MRGRFAILALGAAAGVLAFAPSAVVAALVLGPIAVAVATLWPGLVALALIVVVLLQDWLVIVGLERMQMADEALIAVAVLGIAVRALRSGGIRRTPMDVPLLGFVGVGIVSALVRDVPVMVAALGLLSVVKGLLAFEIFAHLRVGRKAAERGVMAVLAVVVALASIGALQRVGGSAVYRATGRLDYYAIWSGGKAPSLMLNHNALGHICVMGGLLAVGLALSYSGWKSRRLMLAALVCLAGLVVSASRESWLAMAAALPAGAIVTGSRRLWKVALATVVVLAIGAVAVYFASPFLRAEIARRSSGVLQGWHSYRLGYSGWAYRGEYRVYVLLKSLEVFRDHLLLGTGPGRFGGQVALVYPSPIYELYRFLPLRGEYHPLDVFWSRLLAESGLIGTAFYLAALFVATRVHLVARKVSDPLLRGLAIGGWMSVVAVIVIGVFAPALEDPLVAVPFWAWAGFTWSLWSSRAEATEA